MLETFLETVGSSVTSEVTAGLGKAAPIVAILAAFGIGWKLYKKVTGART